jgi:hypothetical protein
MTKPIIQIGDEVREMTTSEIAQYEIDKAEEQAQIEALETKATAKKLVLAKLGLSEEELDSLLFKIYERQI